MKKLPFLVLVVFACTTLLAAQSPDKHRFGDRDLHVPAPDGFTNVIGRFTSIDTRTRAIEDSGNDVLAIHVPDSFVSKLTASENIDLEFYTKVSTSKSVRTVDINDRFYKVLIGDLEKIFGRYLDPNGELMKSLEKNSEKGLAGIGSKTSIDMTSSRAMGFFESSDRVFSGMSLLEMEIYGRKIKALGTVSIIHVKERLVFAFAYKMFPAESDIKELTGFTQKWTARIVAANK